MTDSPSTPPSGDEPLDGAAKGADDAAKDAKDAAEGASETASGIIETIRHAFDDLAEKATPAVREASARAAELTSAAATKAVPLARKAGEATADASGKLAVKSKAWASDLRASASHNGDAAGDAAPGRGEGRRRCRRRRGRHRHEGRRQGRERRRRDAARLTPPPTRHRPGASIYFAAMSVRPIVLLGDPRLRLKGLPVDSFGKYLHELLDDLAHTMRDAPGVGLAAPQLGEALQACVIEVENHLYELVNPKIVRSTGDDRDLEGCLSIPGYVAYVTRREKVWVVAQDRQGRKIKVAGSGLLGRALQHELDHLDGRLYIDYLDSMDELMAVGSGEDEDDAEVREATSALA